MSLKYIPLIAVTSSKKQGQNSPQNPCWPENDRSDLPQSTANTRPGCCPPHTEVPPSEAGRSGETQMSPTGTSAENFVQAGQKLLGNCAQSGFFLTQSPFLPLSCHRFQGTITTWRLPHLPLLP